MFVWAGRENSSGWWLGRWRSLVPPSFASTVPAAKHTGLYVLFGAKAKPKEGTEMRVSFISTFCVGRFCSNLYSS